MNFSEHTKCAFDNCFFFFFRTRS